MSAVSTKSLCNRLRNEWYYALSRMGIECHPLMPSFVSIEPVNRCQLRCPECPVGLRNKAGDTRPTHLLSIEDMQEIVRQIEGQVDTIQLFFQGEPLLHPHLPDLITCARRARIYTIVSTNALAVTPILARRLMESGLNRLIVSIDGMSEDSYQQYRIGGSLHKAVEGLTMLRQAKEELLARTHIELQCLRLKSNEHEWAMMRRAYRKMGADSLTFKTAQLYDYENGHPLMPSDPRYSRYIVGADGLYHPKNRLHPSRRTVCHRLWTGCVIDVEGNVRPCCFDKEGKYILGNIRQQSLREIWNSERAKEFRREVMNHRSGISMCSNCTE